MTTRYSANLSMLWADRPQLERFDAAAAAGFTSVEMLFPQSLSVESLIQALESNALSMSLFDLYAGDWESGERGLAALPDRIDEFRGHWDEDLALASRLGTTTMTVLAGIRAAAGDPTEHDQVLVENLRQLAARAAPLGITLAMEAINNVDVPGYHVRTVDHAAAIVEQVGLGNVKIQFDQYHVGRESQDPLALVEKHFAQIGHVQIADVPGRHEPGTGSAPIVEVLARLDALGYRGRVGLEYIPSTDTDASLSWLPMAARGG